VHTRAQRKAGGNRNQQRYKENLGMIPSLGLQPPARIRRTEEVPSWALIHPITGPNSISYRHRIFYSIISRDSHSETMILESIYSSTKHHEPPYSCIQPTIAWKI
jgi:hypothetical protein